MAELIPSEPLAGLVVSANSALVHLTLLICQPICLWFYRDYDCFQTSQASSIELYMNRGNIWMAIHFYCFAASVLTKLLKTHDKGVLKELCQVIDCSRIPVYFFTIFGAHYFNLNQIADIEGYQIQCGLKSYNLNLIWLEQELRFFYAYIVTAILFVMITWWSGGISQSSKAKHSMVFSNDFLESSKQSQRQFSLCLFEFVATVLTVVQVVVTDHSTNHEDSNIMTLVLLVMFGMLSSF